MNRLAASLARNQRVRTFLRRLRFHRLGNWWLHRFPRKGRMKGSDILYRSVRMESIPLAHEMLETDSLYDASLLPSNLSTFADLGCNAGYFACWLAHHTRAGNLNGILVDANPEAVAEATWHVQANGWRGMSALHGVVGETSASGFIPFHLYDSNLCSSTEVPTTSSMRTDGRWERIEVPCLKIENEWRKRVGDRRCHLLKVDIEGSEMCFFQAEPDFLKRADSVLVEWHEWRVKWGDLRRLLEESGFELVKILDRGLDMGTAFFRRPGVSE